MVDLKDDQRDELQALESICGEDYLLHEDNSFSIFFPFTGSGDSHGFRFRITIRFSPDYPNEPLKDVKVQLYSGMARADSGSYLEYRIKKMSEEYLGTPMIFQILEYLKGDFDIIQEEVSYGDFTVFPEEVLRIISSYLDIKTLCRLAQTSKTWNRITSSNDVWKDIDDSAFKIQQHKRLVPYTPKESPSNPRYYKNLTLGKLNLFPIPYQYLVVILRRKDTGDGWLEYDIFETKKNQVKNILTDFNEMEFSPFGFFFEKSKIYSEAELSCYPNLQKYYGKKKGIYRFYENSEDLLEKNNFFSGYWEKKNENSGKQWEPQKILRNFTEMLKKTLKVTENCGYVENIIEGFLMVGVDPTETWDRREFVKSLMRAGRGPIMKLSDLAEALYSPPSALVADISPENSSPKPENSTKAENSSTKNENSSAIKYVMHSSLVFKRIQISHLVSHILQYENLLILPTKTSNRSKYLNHLVSAANVELEPKVRKMVGKNKNAGNYFFTDYSFDTCLSESVYGNSSFKFWLVNDLALKDLL